MVRINHQRVVMLFTDLGLIEPVLRAVEAEGYRVPTPIQAQTIPHILAGRDVVGCAQTGTGKTAAFALPLIQRLAQTTRAVASKGKPRPAPRLLVLCPTRELALQIADSFRTYGKFLGLRYALIYGGVNQNPQVDSLRRGVDVIVATPGRLMDLMQQGHIDLMTIQTLVLDEADRMLDMGFIEDIRRIVRHMPRQRQTLLFSATMPEAIRRLAQALLSDPAEVQIAPEVTTAEGIDQVVYLVNRPDKTVLLAHLVQSLNIDRGIVFTRTKHGADRLVRHLVRHGIRAQAIHSDKSQSSRVNALKNFRENKTPLLVATDIASRGIDVDGITHVVNYDLTHDPETYVHRIGRTARAGARGAAISFCDREEVKNLRAIQRLIGRELPIHPVPDMPAASFLDRGGEPVHEVAREPRAARSETVDRPRRNQNTSGRRRSAPTAANTAKPRRNRANGSRAGKPAKSTAVAAAPRRPGGRRKARRA
ncbi:MAG: DEAD/DEAH box helicase [Phycisphaeraceae bacterium]|nr:DEAD/DEAH box helicase [Phycisphaeraceae bacterium]